MSGRITPREIETWSPNSWREIAGNDKAVQQFQQFATTGPCNTLLTGPSRTGKTRLIRLLALALACPNRNGLDPCGKCGSCTSPFVTNNHWYGLWRGIYGSNWDVFHFDCTNFNFAEFDAYRNQFQESSLVYLDEVDKLCANGFEDKLLKVIDESPATWVASAIDLTPSWIGFGKQARLVNRMKDEMRNRFSVPLDTTVPTAVQLERWIHDRCQDWSITIDSPAKTIPIIAKRTRCNVGFVKHVFARAAADPKRVITKELASKAKLAVGSTPLPVRSTSRP